MATLIFDTETSGLYTSKKKYGYPPYTELTAYDTCRVVSICWYIVQNEKVVEQSYYVVKPDNFKIGEESIKIHGITQEYAEDNGVDIKFVMANFHTALDKCKTIVAHNIQFDIHTVQSELYRYGLHNTLELFNDKHYICTMAKGKEYMNYYKNPKLGELYKYIYNEDMKNAHNAIADTHHCYKCYIKMFPSDKSIFFFRDKEVKLTDEQEKVVYADINKNILVIASAGSGKTSTTLSRIKYLIDSGTPEETIMLTTFTRDAANDMKNKLLDIMGYRTQINVGTIDSIAKSYTVYKNENASQDIKDVSEYGSDFLKYIKENPDIVRKYNYLFVDEFQDINETQFNIIAEFYNNNVKIFCVGDDSQNLYTFRGSNIEYILNFEKHFPNNTEVYKLTYNFRSTRDIINMANACMEKNIHQVPKKMVLPDSKKTLPTQKPTIKYFPTQSLQNSYLLTRILELISMKQTDIAVLSPINQPLFHIEELLTQNNIPYVYLDSYKNSIRSYIKSGHVCLCTIHKSKGLEWDHVFLINASDDIFPKIKNEKTIEDDRRVFYVAITRARKSINILYNSNLKTPFVTRFVSELDPSLYDFIDFKPEYNRKSDMDFYYLDKSVTKLIENLDGDDYTLLKKEGIIPMINDIPKIRIHAPHAYTSIITSDNLYSDFGTFIDLYITREITKHFKLKKSQKDKYALATLANVTLINADYDVYKKYKSNFKTNIKYLGKLLQDPQNNSDKIKYILEKNANPISVFHMQVILYILAQIQKNAIKYDLPLEKIPVFNYRFLPADDFEKNMNDSLNSYGDWNKSTIDAVNDIWEVSKCRRILIEYRRRLLYSNIKGTDFIPDFKNLFNDISTNLIEYINSLNNCNDIACHDELQSAIGIYGEIDLRVNDILIDYKTTQSDLSLDWLVQLLCYKTLLEENNKKINTICIYNPLKGICYKIDVSSWNKHKELSEYLINKRDYLMKKYSSI